MDKDVTYTPSQLMGRVLEMLQPQPFQLVGSILRAETDDAIVTFRGRSHPIVTRMPSAVVVRWRSTDLPGTWYVDVNLFRFLIIDLLSSFCIISLKCRKMPLQEIILELKLTIRLRSVQRTARR